ncbi:hypothetical protein E5082_05320 [Streptomyces griseoluteus]|uniref:DUF4156 domain-containing protein n=1 Tax=Streptomyces griseoluteus TaxID=29306 RepID=A0A4Z1DTX8_STRGP|nr:hypothetical protein [Streptomyces griseoluteus]TGN87803.1 hypothetical protein E5082_05320 [Streptomyces griseoluteus]GHF24331.1 hypothetical protein GCM10017776_48520 [Streptomyces griseoluteus]
MLRRFNVAMVGVALLCLITACSFSEHGSEPKRAKPQKGVIVNARLERESKVKLSGREAADKQMIVANAAAQDVAQQLGCQGTNLSKGAPKAISGLYGPH